MLNATAVPRPNQLAKIKINHERATMKNVLHNIQSNEYRAP